MKQARLTVGQSLVLAVCIAGAGSAMADVADQLDCYKVKDALTLSGTLDLKSAQFAPQSKCKVSSTALFCVPASKSNVKVMNKASGTPVTPLPFSAAPEGGRICYKLKCPKPSPPIPNQPVTDQFGNRMLAKFRASMVCTPAVTGAAFCGNGTVDPGEECDGTNLNGGTCESEGFAKGTLACAPGCTFDTSACVLSTVPGCGNGVREGAESCDGSDLGGATCASLGFNDGGTLVCGPGCMFDTTGCVPSTVPGCGNGVREGAESCDGSDLGGATCASLGFDNGGTLACTTGCGFDVSLCRSQAFPATGQTTVYAAGDDGDLRQGAPLSYTDNGDGTVTDNNTGRMWEKKSHDGGLHDLGHCFPWAGSCSGSGAPCQTAADCPGGQTCNVTDCQGTKMTVFQWVAQLNAEGGAGFAGHNDWRLANVKELQSIANYENANPAVSPAFNHDCSSGCTVTTCSCTAPSYHWSSTSNAFDPSQTWGVNFLAGFVGPADKKGIFLVRAVRTPSP